MANEQGEKFGLVAGELDFDGKWYSPFPGLPDAGMLRVAGRDLEILDSVNNVQAGDVRDFVKGTVGVATAGHSLHLLAAYSGYGIFGTVFVGAIANTAAEAALDQRCDSDPGPNAALGTGVALTNKNQAAFERLLAPRGTSGVNVGAKKP